MTPHRPPPGIPVNLLEPTERLACAESDPTDWARACREAGQAAIHARIPPEQVAFYRTYGLVPSRRPGNLGEHHIGDDLGREVLMELAAKRRRR